MITSSFHHKQVATLCLLLISDSSKHCIIICTLLSLVSSFHVLFVGPSAPVASAVADSSTAISVTWTQPEFLNGVLQSYAVTGLLSPYIHACKNHSHLCVTHVYLDLQSMSHFIYILQINLFCSDTIRHY